MEPNKRTNFAQGIFFILLFIGTVIVAGILKLTASVVLPLAIAILLSLVFEPIITMLNRRFKIPWVLGIIIVILIMAAVIYVLGSILFSSFKTILSLYPKYESRFKDIYEWIATRFDLPYDAQNSLFDNLWGQLGIRSHIQGLAFSLSNSFIKILQGGVVVLLFIVFFLLEMKFFRAKIEYAFHSDHPGKISGIISDVISQITKYLSVKFFISLLTGVGVYLGLLIIGMDFPVLWGVISFVLNFIPNFGSIGAGVLTALFALVQFWPQPGPVIAVIALMLLVNMVLGNFVEPRVQGKNLGLSPFLIVASLSVWGWIWGFAGLVLAVPMMVILKIICENVTLLHPLSVLMGTYVPPQPPPSPDDGAKPPETPENSSDTKTN